MNTLTINYGSAVITTRRATVLDNLNRVRLARKCVEWVGDDELLDNLVWNWITLVTRTTSLENVPYVLPTAINTPAELQESFDLFTALEAEMVDRWTDGINQANEPINDKRFTPQETVDSKS